MASKVVEYHLEDTITKLFQEGMSINKITQIINEKYLPSQGDTISDQAIRKWVDINVRNRDLTTTKQNTNLPSFAQTQVTADEDVNPYTETLQLIEVCDNQIMILNKILNDERNNTDEKVIRSSNQTRELLATYVAKKQSLLSDVAKYQKDMSSFTNIKERMQLVYKVLRDVSPDAYDEFRRRLGDSFSLRGL